MSTFADDVVLLQASSPALVGAGAGNDRYILSSALLAPNQSLQIVDTIGANVLHLVGGLTIASAKVASDALQLTVDNGATITLLGARGFEIWTGGDPLTGVGSLKQSFEQFVVGKNGLGLASLPTSGIVAISDVTVLPTGGTSTGPDRVPPTLASTVPLDDATNVAVGENIVLTFSEAVKAGTGSVRIVNQANAADTRVIAVTDTSQVMFSGRVVTINPASDLLANAPYHVIVPAGAILDLAGNAYAGISDPTALNFTTAGGSVGLGNTIQLTSGADAVGPGVANPLFRTTGNDDVVRAPNGEFSPTADTIDGGNGVDTLVAYGVSGNLGLSNVSNVERLQIRAIGDAVVDVGSLRGFSDAASTRLHNDGSRAPLSFENIPSLATELWVTDGATYTAFSFQPAALAGANDAVRLRLDGVGTVEAPGIVWISPGVERMEIEATGRPSAVRLTEFVPNVRIAGDARLVLGVNPPDLLSLSRVVSFDASAHRGGVEATMSLAAGPANIIGSAGPDVIALRSDLGTVTRLQLGSGDDTLLLNPGSRFLPRSGDTLAAVSGASNIDGGPGLDRIVFRNLVGATPDYAKLNALVGFEEIAFNERSDSLTFDVGRITNGIKRFVIIGGEDGTDAAVRFDNVVDGTTLILEGEPATNGATMTIGMGAGQSAFELRLRETRPSSTVESYFWTIEPTTASSLALVSEGDAANRLRVRAVAENAVVTLSGSRTLEIDFDDVGSFRFDASAARGAVSLRAFSGDSASATIVGGSGNDTIVAGTGNDSVIGGLGDDVLFGSNGDDTLSGGEGNDRLNGGMGNDVLLGGPGNDTLVGGEGSDTMTGGSGSDRFVIVRHPSGANIVAVDFGLGDPSKIDGGDRIVFDPAGRPDVVTDFTPSVDVLEVSIPNSVFGLFGTAANAALPASTAWVRGSWNDATNTFTIGAAGVDMLVFDDPLAAPLTADAQDGRATLLLGVAADLAPSWLV